MYLKARVKPLSQGDQGGQLFTALASELRRPLLQIARLSQSTETTDPAAISAISEHALMLVDAYARSQTQDQTKLLLEPLTSSAVLYDVAAALQPFAKQWDCTIEIDSRGRGVPVMAHRESLKTMLTLLGASLIEGYGDQADAPRRLVLGTHRTAAGTVVGAFSSHKPLSQTALQMVRELHGRAAQAVPSMGSAGSAGLAIADRLSQQMETPLKAYRHRSYAGIGSLLVPSRQLQLTV